MSTIAKFSTARGQWASILLLLLLVGSGCDSGTSVEVGSRDGQSGVDLQVADVADLYSPPDLAGDSTKQDTANGADLRDQATEDASQQDAAPDSAESLDVLVVPDVLSVGKGPGLEGKEGSETEQGETKLLIPELEISDAPRWKLVWRDEFNGPQPDEDPACYSRPPQCQYKTSGGSRDCPKADWPQLAKLNKCNWAVYSFFNYMSANGGASNAFRSDQVKVANGLLIMTAVSQPGPYDCGRQIPDPLEWDGLNATTSCAFLSGGLATRQIGNTTTLKEGIVPGFHQTYGRFEIRARLSHGPGTWPAIWMMHQTWDYGWPYDGEIDIMELWSDSSKKVTGAYHGGDPTDQVHLVDRHPWVAKKDYYPQDDRKETWHNDFHIFAIEWDENELRFYVDKWLIGVTRNGKSMKSKNGKTYNMKTPWNPFYVILNITIVENLGNWLQNIFNDFRPDPDDFTPQRMEVDWVRVYRQCQSDSDYCPWGGSFGKTHCSRQLPPAGELKDGKLSYPSSNGACPDGGKLDGDRCVLQTYPGQANARISGDKLLTDSPCVENTINRQCKNPCGGQGWYNGYGCLLGAAPDGFKINLSSGKFYYKQKWLGSVFAPKDCKAEHPYVDGEGCLLGSVPGGRTGVVVNQDGQSRYYLEALCNPLEGLANCTNPCPIDGFWDGANCKILVAPGGTVPFLYEGSFYIPATNGACPNGGSFDGANCLLYKVPAGGEPFIYQNTYYIKSTCGPLPYKDATGL